MPTYTRAKLLLDIATMVTTADSSTNIEIVANNSVRSVLSDVDLRSTKRKTALTPPLFENIYDYSAPADLKGNKIVDIQSQVSRSKNNDWVLTTEQEFDRIKTENDGLICVVDSDMTKRIRVSLDVDNDHITIDGLNAVNGWLLFGDGENLTTDNDNYVKGSGSINWDISSAGGTTAGIYNPSVSSYTSVSSLPTLPNGSYPVGTRILLSTNSKVYENIAEVWVGVATIPVLDISDYKTTGSAYVWAYISSTTNLTNFILRVGSISTAYYYITITTTNEGLAIQAGWNLLRFDFVNKATTGTPDDDACDYVALYMTKAEAKISETDYRFNNLIIGNGSHYNLIYYSRYLWQSNAAVYLENSTASTDYLNCEGDEYNLFLLKTAELTERDAHNFDRADALKADYERKLMEYKQRYPSEAILPAGSYWNKTY